jgi:hypothetical protein
LSHSNCLVVSMLTEFDVVPFQLWSFEDLEGARVDITILLKNMMMLLVVGTLTLL